MHKFERKSPWVGKQFDGYAKEVALFHWEADKLRQIQDDVETIDIVVSELEALHQPSDVSPQPAIHSSAAEPSVDEDDAVCPN